MIDSVLQRKRVAVFVIYLVENVLNYWSPVIFVHGSLYLSLPSHFVDLFFFCEVLPFFLVEILEGLTLDPDCLIE